MPFVASSQDPVRHPLIGVPVFARSEPVLVMIRLAAAGAAVVCLLLSIQCWRHMGSDWRMGVEPSNDHKLITDGPFARVRHPIYSLSVALMSCSVVVVPTPAVLAIASVHIFLMFLKVRNEEVFLLKTHGQSFKEYCCRTGRLWPRFRAGH
jgi:protein-S-isoprenylcysteine O-methyltransferase Ste14